MPARAGGLAGDPVLSYGTWPTCGCPPPSISATSGGSGASFLAPELLDLGLLDKLS
jgi:hypothetical protein